MGPWLCASLEVLCEYPEFATQVFQGRSVPVLARVFARVRDVPNLEMWRHADTRAAACRALCWVLHFHPEAGMVVVGVDVFLLLVKPFDHQVADELHTRD